MVKCNVDGAWKDGKGGLGVIVRDSLGNVVLSGVFPELAAVLPLHIELLAILKALEVAAAFNLQHLQV